MVYSSCISLYDVDGFCVCLSLMFNFLSVYGCTGGCGPNAVCKNGKFCACKPGYGPNPVIGCKPGTNCYAYNFYFQVDPGKCKQSF